MDTLTMVYPVTLGDFLNYAGWIDRLRLNGKSALIKELEAEYVNPFLYKDGCNLESPLESFEFYLNSVADQNGEFYATMYSEYLMPYKRLMIPFE